MLIKFTRTFFIIGYSLGPIINWHQAIRDLTLGFSLFSSRTFLKKSSTLWLSSEGRARRSGSEGALLELMTCETTRQLRLSLSVVGSMVLLRVGIFWRSWRQLSSLASGGSCVDSRNLRTANGLCSTSNGRT